MDPWSWNLSERQSLLSRTFYSLSQTAWHRECPSQECLDAVWEVLWSLMQHYPCAPTFWLAWSLSDLSWRGCAHLSSPLSPPTQEPPSWPFIWWEYWYLPETLFSLVRTSVHSSPISFKSSTASPCCSSTYSWQRRCPGPPPSEQCFLHPHHSVNSNSFYCDEEISVRRIPR